MVTQQFSVPTKTLDDVAYLARSANRIALLAAIVRRPRTRRELHEETGIPRATSARIVGELEDRGWVERGTNGRYDPTPTGEHVVGELQPFLESMTAIHRLGEAIDWLPTDELDIDLRHFADATVVRLSNDDPAEVVDILADIVAETRNFRTLTQFAPPVPIETLLEERASAGQMELSVVATPELIDYLRAQPSRRKRWQNVLSAGTGLHCYDGPIPCNVWVMDETTIIKKSGANAREQSYGVPVVTQNDTVREWATELIQKYRDEATPVNPDDFADSRDTSDSSSEETGE